MAYPALRWRNVSISKKLYVVVGVMTALIACELLTLRFAMHTLSAARALVGGEALWSKAQKNAAISIQRYGVSKNEADYASFLEALKIPEGDHEARLELLKKNPDLSVVRDGFMKGHVHPDDVGPVISLLTRFGRVSYLSRAVGIWTKGDGLLAQFKDAGISYHEAMLKNDPVSASDSFKRLGQINDELTALEEEFSYVLGEGSRWLEYVVLAALASAVLIVESVGLTLTFLTSRALSMGLDDLNNTALAIGHGQFNTRASIETGDELGRLGAALNHMGELLQKTYVDLETRVKARTSELAESRDQLNIVLNGISDGITVIDASGKFVYANESGARMCGFPTVEDFLRVPQREFAGLFELFDENGRIYPWQNLPSQRIFAGERNPPEVVLQTVFKKTNERRWTILKSSPVYDEDGRVKLVVTISKDITEARRTEDSLRILDETSRILASSLDFQETLKNVALLAVPKMADWCAIDVIEEDGHEPRSIALAHRDPEKLVWAQEVSRKFPPDWNASRGVANVIRTGHSELYSYIPDEWLVDSARSEEHLRLIREVGMKSVMIVPLISRSKTFGVLTFISAESGRMYDERDLAFAERVAKRIATAIDNSLLYRHAQKAVEARDEFMSIASHELKTPITSLSLQIQMAKQGISIENQTVPKPEKLAKVFDVAGKQVDRLTDLVEDLLDASRIQLGKFSFNFEKGDLSELVTEMASRSAVPLSKSNCTLVTEIEPGISGFFDAGRIQQIIDNLLSNTAKYARGSFVKVMLKRNATGAEIIVEDNGPGIPRDKQPSIFERFERAASAKNISGMGLGLFIVREIAKGHGGSVQLASEPGHGSKFTVLIPLGVKTPGSS